MKLHLGAAVCALVVLTSCGQDAQSCALNSVAVSNLTNNCASTGLSATPTITIRLCPTSCAQSGVRCTPEVVGSSEIALYSEAQECDEARGCTNPPPACETVSCAIRQTLAPGTYTVRYTTSPSAPVGSATSIDVVGAGGISSCTL